MAQPQDHISMALFCDFENVALGVRDANYDKFDIKRVLERLLLKGSIVVKKAYCDWERYKGFKSAMHEANFELIEIPHVRQSGKNSADIRLVVDALDLCYTKSHVNTFVIISGDSDFSPLVSKLRENAKYVIGVGVKQSTSDLLIANCDEFIFYDDLVRESQRQRSRDSRDQQPPLRRSPEEEKRRREEMDARRTKVIEMAAETYEALVTDRDEGGRVWASVLKEALKRRNPGFSEQYYGFRTFGNLLEEAQTRGLLDLGRDEKSGLFVMRGTGVALRTETAVEQPASAPKEAAVEAVEVVASPTEASTSIAHRTQPAGAGEPETHGGRGTRSERGGRGRRGGRRGRGEEGSSAADAMSTSPQTGSHGGHGAPPAPTTVPPTPPVATSPVPDVQTAVSAPAVTEPAHEPVPKARKTASKTAGRTASKTAAKSAAKTPAKKAAPRSPRTRQTTAAKKDDTSE